MLSAPLTVNPVAYIYVAHYLSPSIVRGYRNIEQAVKNIGVSWFLFQGEITSIPKPLHFENFEIVTRQDILSLNYRMPNKWLIPGASHFPLFNFYKRHPDYSYYWEIEYDVRYSGNWQDFFEDFLSVDADYIAPHLRRYEQEPDWIFWDITHPTKTIALTDRIRCFHPISRLSNRAVAFLCSIHQDGWCGHDEVIRPTLLENNGFSIMDFGGEGKFVPAGMENKYYTSTPSNPEGKLESGTFRYRPAFRKAGTEKNKLYHPVKPVNIKLKIRMALDRILGKKFTQKMFALRESIYKAK